MMSIIEAIQHAESGYLITCSFYESQKIYLRYIGGGVFNECKTINGRETVIDSTTRFSTAYILTNTWKLAGF